MFIIYHVVPHDEGWAYRLGDVFSEPFPSHAVALKAAHLAAMRHEKSDEEDMLISYQTKDGRWHEEVAGGQDRPETEIEDAGEAIGK